MLKIYFKTKNFLVIFLNENQFLYILKCNSAKEMWDTLEMIYGLSPSIKQNGMNTRDEEDECFFHKCFSNFKNIWRYVRTFVSNKYIRVKNWNQKSDPILKLRNGNLYDFLGKIQEERNNRETEWVDSIVKGWRYGLKSRIIFCDFIKELFWRRIRWKIKSSSILWKKNVGGWTIFGRFNVQWRNFIKKRK